MNNLLEDILYFHSLNPDEMYAAIDEQDKVYTSGSETYAQIQPTATEIQRTTQMELSSFPRTPSHSDETLLAAPQPPSVDSLRHVAHAHSRQGKLNCSLK